MKSTILRPISWMYSGLMQVRNAAYDHGFFTQYKCDVPVISIGNLSVGGTGKTPLVEHLASYFNRDGKTVGIVSRGYKRQSQNQIIVSRGNGPEVSPDEAGDEPFMLAALHPDLRVVVDADRVSAAKTAVCKLDVDIILMDDGFQHRALARDVNIVLLPAEDILHGERVLPAGRLRESWDGLRRATHILVTSIPGIEKNRKGIQNFLAHHTNAKIFHAEKRTLPVFMNPVRNENIALAEYEKPLRAFALAGIGNPEQFRESLENFVVEVTDFRALPDHYPFPKADQQRFCEEFRASGADVMVMTAKDFVKWDQEIVEKEKVYFLPVEYTIDPPLYPDVKTYIE